MNNYYKVYEARLNRNGTNSVERLNKGREENFQKFLNQSPHKVTFDYEGIDVDAVFEPRKQDQTKVMMNLLVAVDYEFQVGKIVTIEGDRYMFYWIDERKNSGYNRWVMVKMSRTVTWTNEDGTQYSSEAYTYGQEDNMLKNEIKSRTRSAVLYQENLKLSFMLMPQNANIQYDSYLTITEGEMSENFRVTGFDFLSTPGILYVSMDPTIRRDLTPAPDSDGSENFFWLGGV